MSARGDVFLAFMGMVLGVSVANRDWLPAALMVMCIAQEVGRNWLDRRAIGKGE